MRHYLSAVCPVVSKVSYSQNCAVREMGFRMLCDVLQTNEGHSLQIQPWTMMKERYVRCLTSGHSQVKTCSETLYRYPKGFLRLHCSTFHARSYILARGHVLGAWN